MSLTIDTCKFLEFFDAPSQRTMRFIYPGQSHSWSGWLCWRNVDGQWVSLRRASDSDIAEIHKAVKDVESRRIARQVLAEGDGELKM